MIYTSYFSLPKKQEVLLHSLSLSHLKLQSSVFALPLPNENTNVDFQCQTWSLPSPLLMFYSHMYTFLYDKLMYNSFDLPSITWVSIYCLLVQSFPFNFIDHCPYHKLARLTFKHIKLYCLCTHNFLSFYNILKFFLVFHFPRFGGMLVYLSIHLLIIC